MIYGYQACEVSGSVYIDADGKGSEYLSHISDGDRAVFRYVESENGFSRAVLNTLGKAEVRILLDGKVAGVIQIEEDGEHELVFSAAQSKDISQEVVLEFLSPSNFKVIGIIMYD